jgi:EmrB/QacA subfamily drug resistance transporter
MHTIEHRKKMIIMSAVMASMLFSALNQTTIGTALPRIITDLGGLEYFSWVFTAYILAASIPAVLVGRISDIYGRKPFILGGLVIFTFGSLLCGLSDSLVQLILFRALQGVGGGIIMATTFAAVGDLFVPRERGKWQGMLGAMFGLASVFGPALGGMIVDHWHWHWVFWIFTPLGLIAFGMIWYLFPAKTHHEEHTIDYLGALLLTLIIVPLLLMFSLGGQRFPWGSPLILALFLGSMTALLLFIRIEQRARDPILPLFLFRNQVFSLSNTITFLMGAGMFGALIYLPLFLQGVQGYSAMHSGAMMVPMTLSLVAASIFGGRRMSRTGRYRYLALIGMMTTTLGLYLLSRTTMETSLVSITLTVMLVGAGLGIGMPVFTLSIQNALEHKYLGVATASSQLFRQLGGTIGVALMGTLLNHAIARNIAERIAALPQLASLPLDVITQFENPRILVNPSSLLRITDALPAPLQSLVPGMVENLKLALQDALSLVFLSASLAMLSTVILVWFLQEIPLRESMDIPKEEE